ncbi:hypothetical protein BHE18_13055 [Rossellomorea aquimaris]|uniref:Uncharacterized protein n=1 Tax=Rossellomorea aquimaris TaxID=189382 RepID=A0A1J6VTN0_9BACI|nr:hypothetical protein BHE18_13055 [Rossellomorea aquimaris]
MNGIQRLIGVEDEDSCGESEAVETPQAKPRRLHARPRKAKSSTEIISVIKNSIFLRKKPAHKK